MSVVMEINPFNFFTDTNGDALDAGYVYIGEANKDPRQYPVSVYYDFETTIPAMMPLRTSSGYIVRNGSPTFLFVNGNYSVMVLDSRGRQIYYVPNFLLIGNQSAVTPSDLAGPNGAGMIGFIQAGANVIARTLLQRGRDAVSIADYANATVDAADAISKMAVDYGFIRIPFGVFPIATNLTISVPITFDLGGSITVASGITVNINNSIESPRQYIFQGAGTYALGHSHVTDTGENARQIHVSWFGAFPNPDPGPDQSPFIQKAMDSMGNGRECEVNFDIGNYNMSSGVTCTRAAHVRGRGQRRTVFKTDTDGFPLFTTGNIACRFSGFGFEKHASLTSRISPYLKIAHEACDVYDISVGEIFSGIEISGLNCRCWNVIAGYGNNPGLGSSVIRITQGGATVRDVFCLTSSAFGPSAVIKLEPDAPGTLSNTLIQNINSIMPSETVQVVASAGSVSNVTIKEVRYNGFAGTAPDSVIHLQTGADKFIRGVVIDDVVFTTYSVNGIKLEQSSSTLMRDISIDNVMMSGNSATGYGIGFIKTLGELSNITIGSNVNVKGKTTPFFYSGNPTFVVVDPAALPNGAPAVCYDFTISDDSVAQINLNRSVFTGILMVTAGFTNYAVLSIRAAATPNVANINISANMASTNTVLTGTTGVDGRFTIGITDGVIYLENRLGSAQRVSANILTGVIS